METGAQRRNCGLFSDMTGQINALLDKEKLIQGLTGSVKGIIASAPTTLMCYSSQTLCDIYKFMRNQANFTGQMNQLSCQQYEQLGQGIGESLRSKAVQKCAMEKAEANGTGDYAKYVSECEQNADKLPVEVPGTGVMKEGGYNLSEYIAKRITNDEKIQESLRQLLGDVKFSATGIRGQRVPRLGEEQMLDNYTRKYYSVTKEIVESSVKSNSVPDAAALKVISTPGFPITPYFVQKIRYMNPASRESFYEQYATVAGMNATLFKIEELVDTLENAKNDNKDKASVEAIERDIRKLERKYDLLAKRLQLQKEYLSPIFLEVMNYRGIPDEPVTSEDTLRMIVPKGISKE